MKTTSRLRLWAFRCCAVILAPSLAFGLLELFLHIVGYGYPTSFFLLARIGGSDYYVTNDRFGYRFFPSNLARTPTPQRIAAAKPANTYRIFLFGESAAQGDPDPTFGVGRYLQILLHERYPGTDFEVVSATMTAINSHALLPIARNCARLDGDLWIVYMGNNEMVGPFGAGTVFGPAAPGNRLIRTILALKATRTGQLLERLAHAFSRNRGMPQTWGGLKMFQEHIVPYDDPGRQRVYRNFRANLEDILWTGRRVKVPILLSTVACNLKDCGPFVSVHSKTLNDDQRVVWEQAWGEGVALQTNGAWTEALKAYCRAASLDPKFAELQFRMGQCELKLTNFSEASACFRLARDYDALDFRADTEINRIICEVVGRFTQGVKLVDAADILAKASPAGVPGNELFWEHVHLNFSGNYLLARAFAEQLATLLPTGIVVRATSAWATEDLCNQRLAVSLWDQYRLWQENFSRVSQPPFTQQLNDVPRAHMYMARLEELRAQMSTEARESARKSYQAALAVSPNDEALHHNYAQFLYMIGEISAAVEQQKRVCELLPVFPEPVFRAGQFLVCAGRIEEARECFRRALALRGNYVPALNELGMILANARNTAEATVCFNEALRINPGYVESRINLGFLAQHEGKTAEAMSQYNEAASQQPDGPADYFKRGVAFAEQHQRSDAIDFFHEAVEMNPAFWQARYLLGVELAGAGKVQEAREKFAEVVLIRPDFAKAHLNLGVALAKEEKTDDAEREFRAAVRLDPADLLAQQQLETLERWKQLRKVNHAGSFIPK